MTRATVRMKVPDETQTSKRIQDADIFHPVLLAAIEISNKTYEMRRDDSAVQKQHQQESAEGWILTQVGNSDLSAQNYILSCLPETFTGCKSLPSGESP